MILMVGSGIRKNPRNSKTCGASTEVDEMPAAWTGKVGMARLEGELGSIREVSSLSLGSIQVKMTKRSG